MTCSQAVPTRMARTADNREEGAQSRFCGREPVGTFWAGSADARTAGAWQRDTFTASIGHQDEDGGARWSWQTAAQLDVGGGRSAVLDGVRRGRGGQGKKEKVLVRHMIGHTAA